MLGFKALQDLFTRDVLAGLGLLGFVHDLQLAEEDVAYLFRTSDVECLTGFLVYFLFILLHAVGEYS